MWNFYNLHEWNECNSLLHDKGVKVLLYQRVPLEVELSLGYWNKVEVICYSLNVSEKRSSLSNEVSLCCGNFFHLLVTKWRVDFLLHEWLMSVGTTNSWESQLEEWLSFILHERSECNILLFVEESFTKWKNFSLEERSSLLFTWIVVKVISFHFRRKCNY